MNAVSLSHLMSFWRLAEPWGLIALLLCPLPCLAQWRRPRLAWPTLDGFRLASATKRSQLRYLPCLLKSLAIACLAVALSRPQSIGGEIRIAAKGVAIEVAIDRSSSMTTADFPSAKGPITRLVAAKTTLERFIEARPDDLIGVVSFANIPIRISPPTLDHAFVLDATRSIRPARAGEGGTSLGLAIAMSLGELRPVKTPRKVVVLLTDGRDEPAASESFKPIAPEDAARLARRLGITLHTIAVGRAGTAMKLGDPMKAGDELVVDQGPDLVRLEAIATLGGGRAFTAADVSSLEAVFTAIDSLEKSPVAGTIRTRYREEYPEWIGAALVLIVLDRWLQLGPLRSLP